MLDLDFKLLPSRQYITLIMLSVFVSLGIVLFLPFMTGIKLTGLALIVAYGGYLLWRYGFLLSQHSIYRIRREEDERWILYTPHEHYQATLCGESTVTNFVSILRFRIREQRRPLSCMIFRDSLTKGRYRRLLVTLKMG